MRLVLMALDSGDLALQEIVLWLSGNCMIESVPIGTFLLQNGRLMHFIDNVSLQKSVITENLESVLLWNL